MPTLIFTTAKTGSNSDVETALTLSTTSSSAMSLPGSLLLTLLLIAYLLVPHIFKWRFPYQTPQDLEQYIVKLQKVIYDNSSLDRDLLGSHAEAYKRTLNGLKEQLKSIKTRMSLREPRRTNPFLWVLFRWRVIRDVDGCFVSLKALEGEVKVKVYGDGLKRD
ncbi:hypothetical protein VNI00_005248 [Paramarasmius palmivorus]|uniref:Uncharacterized protein n=1 Tax=Paramarasmius palmivorus TaxID=297713 RepID=A0AAW0DB08_9AGAR